MIDPHDVVAFNTYVRCGLRFGCSELPTPTELRRGANKHISETELPQLLLLDIKAGLDIANHFMDDRIGRLKVCIALVGSNI